MKYLIKHFKNHTTFTHEGDKPYAQIQFMMKYLKKHKIVVHEGDKPYQCKVCDKKFEETNCY